MKTPKLLVIVRHAESLRNVFKKNLFVLSTEKEKLSQYSDETIPLSASGREQATHTGRKIISEFKNFDVAFHSGYVRTRDTLNYIKQEFSRETREHIKVYSNVLIRERDCGYTFNMTAEESQKYFPFLEEYWKLFGGYFAAPPGGESLAQVTTRVAIFFEMLCRNYSGKNVLVVSHGGTIACFRGLIESLPYNEIVFWKRGKEPGNCNVTAYSFSEEGIPKILMTNHIF